MGRFDVSPNQLNTNFEVAVTERLEAIVDAIGQLCQAVEAMNDIQTRRNDIYARRGRE